MKLIEAARLILPGLKWKNQRPSSLRSEGILANFPIPGGKQVFVCRAYPDPPHQFTPNQIWSNVPLPPGTTDELEAMRLVRADLEAKSWMLRDALNYTPAGIGDPYLSIRSLP